MFRVLTEDEQNGLSDSQIKEYKRKEKLYGKTKKKGIYRKKSSDLIPSDSSIHGFELLSPGLPELKLRINKSQTLLSTSGFKKSKTLKLGKHRDEKDSASEFSEIEEEKDEMRELN